MTSICTQAHKHADSHTPHLGADNGTLRRSVHPRQQCTHLKQSTRLQVHVHAVAERIKNLNPYASCGSEKLPCNITSCKLSTSYSTAYHGRKDCPSVYTCCDPYHLRNFFMHLFHYTSKPLVIIRREHVHIVAVNLCCCSCRCQRR